MSSESEAHEVIRELAQHPHALEVVPYATDIQKVLLSILEAGRGERLRSDFDVLPFGVVLAPELMVAGGKQRGER